ncbi:hypothetical protein A2631_00900 [Candidatus Daviesbacteria bacterium RIFCSPHIGHO2_01_FULL_44_29]|nr:MAG: hypothetical protein A2631_00900 [Candidatus Daviesbacteria bacterium RIFCSPHIGHO2_01_FULL_44_29]
MHAEFIELPFFHPLYPIYAAESSDSSQLIKQKIDDLKKEIASKAAKIKEDISKHLQNKFILGQIKSSTDKSILVEDNKAEKAILINEFTSFVRTDGTKKVDPKNIVGNFALALGEIDDKNNLLAKKVLISASSPEVDKKVVRGTIVRIEANLLTIRLRDESTASAKLSKKTTLMSAKRNDLGVSDIQPGSLVILVSTQPDETDIARLVYLISQPKPTASPASNAATPSASVKAKN